MKAIVNFSSDSGTVSQSRASVITTHSKSTVFRRPAAVGLLALSAVVALGLGVVLIAHSSAQAAGAQVVAGAVPFVSAATGLLDHSQVRASRLLPEPNPELLHSNPNAYGASSAAEMRAAVTVLPVRPGPHSSLAGVGP
ncbi:MAG: hypothetical protein JWQ72_3013 [Polaromonas sp.]|nr:hypothetical protein [Polaromonas sp.]